MSNAEFIVKDLEIVDIESVKLIGHSVFVFKNSADREHYLVNINYPQLENIMGILPNSDITKAFLDRCNNISLEFFNKVVSDTYDSKLKEFFNFIREKVDFKNLFITSYGDTIKVFSGTSVISTGKLVANVMEDIEFGSEYSYTDYEGLYNTLFKLSKAFDVKFENICQYVGHYEGLPLDKDFDVDFDIVAFGHLISEHYERISFLYGLQYIIDRFKNGYKFVYSV